MQQNVHCSAFNRLYYLRKQQIIFIVENSNLCDDYLKTFKLCNENKIAYLSDKMLACFAHKSQKSQKCKLYTILKHCAIMRLA